MMKRYKEFIYNNPKYRDTYLTEGSNQKIIKVWKWY